MEERVVLVLSAGRIQRQKSLHEQVYQALRDSILTGELAPGERLVEMQIAERLRVSRTPIREAIRQLQLEELIVADELGWLRVATVSPKEASDLYDCRLALESLSVAEACEKATEEQLQQLQAVLGKTERLFEGTEAPDSLPLLELDCGFHLAIARSSGNLYLVSLLERVLAKMALLRVQTARHNPNVLEVRTEHQRLYEAILARDRGLAVRAIQTHLSASKTRVVRELEQLQLKGFEKAIS